MADTKRYYYRCCDCLGVAATAERMPGTGRFVTASVRWEDTPLMQAAAAPSDVPLEFTDGVRYVAGTTADLFDWGFSRYAVSAFVEYLHTGKLDCPESRAVLTESYDTVISTAA